MRHDVPLRLRTALRKFLAGIPTGCFAEENEALKECRVSRDDQDYWQQVSWEEEFRLLFGLTEKGVRLCTLAAAEVAKVERRWREHLGAQSFEALRAALLSLREITDPYR